jgi:hypothetical protein
MLLVPLKFIQRIDHGLNIIWHHIAEVALQAR